MYREVMTFGEYGSVCVDRGWHPVYASNTTDNSDRLVDSVDIDLICDWRVPDGKVKLVTVTFDTATEFDSLVELLTEQVKTLNTTILMTLGKLVNIREGVR